MKRYKFIVNIKKENGEIDSTVGYYDYKYQALWNRFLINLLWRKYMGDKLSIVIEDSGVSTGDLMKFTGWQLGVLFSMFIFTALYIFNR